MLYQLDAIIEIQFLYYYLAVILGVEVSIYAFYHFFKNKDANLKLNRILLSFGAFTLLCIFGAFFLVIIRLLEYAPDLEQFLSNLGFALVMFAPIGYGFFIAIEEYSKILNLRITRILMLLNVIPIIVVLIFSSNSLIFRITIALMVIDALNVVGIQIKLIKISRGEIKKRLIEFFTGEVSALTALIFAANVTFEFLPIPTLLSFFIGTSVLILGFIIIFISTFNFPPFYEFEWKENLMTFFIINEQMGSLLYNYDFILDGEKSALSVESTQYFSGGLMGLESIISTITSSKDKRLKLIKHGDALILLSYSSAQSIPIIYALVVKKDLNSFRSVLETLKVQFESFYKEVLINFDKLNLKDNEGQLFRSFDVIIDNLLRT